MRIGVDSRCSSHSFCRENGPEVKRPNDSGGETTIFKSTKALLTVRLTPRITSRNVARFVGTY